MVVNDIYSPLTKLHDSQRALLISRVVLIAVGCIAGLLAWDPPKLVGLFAQKGVYGLAAASLVPILFGVLLKRKLAPSVIFIAAILGLGVHLVLNLAFGMANPAVTATIAMAVSMGFFLLSLTLSR